MDGPHHQSRAVIYGEGEKAQIVGRGANTPICAAAVVSPMLPPPCRGFLACPNRHGYRVRLIEPADVRHPPPAVNPRPFAAFKPPWFRALLGRAPGVAVTFDKLAVLICHFSPGSGSHGCAAGSSVCLSGTVRRRCGMGGLAKQRCPCSGSARSAEDTLNRSAGPCSQFFLGLAVLAQCGLVAVEPISIAAVARRPGAMLSRCSGASGRWRPQRRMTPIGSSGEAAWKQLAQSGGPLPCSGARAPSRHSSSPPLQEKRKALCLLPVCPLPLFSLAAPNSTAAPAGQVSGSPARSGGHQLDFKLILPRQPDYHCRRCGWPQGQCLQRTAPRPTGKR